MKEREEFFARVGARCVEATLRERIESLTEAEREWYEEAISFLSECGVEKCGRPSCFDDAWRQARCQIHIPEES